MARRAVEALRAMFRVSERFACRVVGQHRRTQRHVGKVDDIEEAKLRRWLREIAAEHIRWGRRMAYRVLRREGWMDGEPQAGASALAGGGPAAAHSQKAEAGQARRWIRAASPSRTPAAGLGHRLPVRRHG